MAWRIVRWIGFALAALVALTVALVLFLDTSPGKRFLADRLAAYETASGVSIHAGRIEGSIYGRMTIRDLRVNDTRGTFLASPALTIDWRPFAYLHSHIDVRALTADSVDLLRKPVLKPTPSDSDAPLLPDIDLTVGKLAIDRFTIEAPVTGRRHVLRLSGAARIADGRAQIAADADALRAAGVAGGDALRLRLDAVPAENRLVVDARLRAPAGGLADSYAHLGRPLALTIGGNGDWTHWRGAAQASLGGERLADLAVTGANGTFHTTGAIRAGLVMAGPVARLTSPVLAIDLTTKLADRTVDTRLRASSSALAVSSVGLIDLGHSRLQQVRVGARLLTPGAIAPNVRGRDVALTALLDGPIATPTVDYRVTAAALGFGTTTVEGLAASGRAAIDADRIRVPLHATARAVTGLNAAAGGLLTRLRIDGDLAYQDGKLASDDLKLRSDRIDATAIVLADLAKGTYTGALKGRINDYQVNGLGRIDLVTDARLVPGLNNGFAVRGHIRAVTRHIDNASVRTQLGGRAVVDADVGYDLAGGATVRNLRLVAPNLRVTGGEGSYRLDGRLAFHAAGRSRTYGPVLLDVSGTIQRPVARLRAASPGAGLGLADLNATLEGTTAGYRIRATGRTSYGPLTADVMLRSGRGPVTFDVADLTLAGVRATGRVVQTPAGPFAGLLTLGGSGVSGTVRLAAAGKVQQAALDIRATAARIPGETPITIGSGTLRATVLLPDAGPQVNGSFQFTNIRQGTITVAHTQGRIAYAGGNGHVALVAAGDTGGIPFDLASQAALTPQRILANLRGSANGVPFRLARPATIVKARDVWQLTPATILLPQGQVDLTGSFGTATTLHAVLRSLDLSIVDAVKPGLGLGGKASGTVDYAARGVVPDVRARIDIAGFTRTASLTVSAPVDIALLATLGQPGADVRAIVRRGATVVGRLQARLQPLGPGKSLTARIMAAPLSGGIRYNGPAEVLWALGGIPRQQLSGPIAAGADFAGRLDQPILNGIVRADALRYENETYGTVLSQMAVQGHFTRSQFQLDRLAAKAGDGTVAAAGTVGLDAAQGFPIDLKLRLDRARLARGDDVDATVSGTITVTNDKAHGGLIKGRLTIPEARYQIVRQSAAAVPELTGVRRKGTAPAAALPPGPVPGNWKLDLRLRADNRIFVSGMGLEAEWRTDMAIGGTTAAPQVVGRLDVVRGTYSFAGKRFALDRGVVTFQGGLFNPALDIAASTTVEEVSATIAIGGTAQSPQIAFTSTPALPQDEVLSRLLFGSSVTSLSPTQAIQLAAALNSLRGSGGGGLNPLGKLRSVAGIDRLRVLGADQSAGRGTSLAAGKYISNNIYVEIITDARGFTATQLEVSLSKALSVLSQAGTFGGSNVSVRYKKRY